MAERSYDTIIIGGGVIGLSIARELAVRGVRRIAVIDKGQCGREASWAAAGMLAPQAEADKADEFFDFCSLSRERYPEFAAGLNDETGVDVELDRAGTLYLALTGADAAQLDERYEWQRKAGLPVERLSAEQTRRTEPFASPAVLGSLLFPDDWQVDNRKLVSALIRATQIHDIDLIENTAVTRIDLENRNARSVETSAGRMHAAHVIVASGAWTSSLRVGPADINIKVKPVRGQILAFQTAKRLFEHVIYSRRGYLVPRADGRILVGSTTEEVGFDRTIAAEAADGLRGAAAEIAPSLTGLDVADHWMGFRPFATDGLPVLGGLPRADNVTIATAHYRNGILLAPLTAKIIADRVADGIDHPAFTTFGTLRLALAPTR